MKLIKKARPLPEFIVDSRLRMTAESAKLYPSLVEDMINACTYENPEYAKWIIFKGTWKPPAKTICSARKENDGTVSFPRGAIYRLSKLTGDNIIVHDKRVATEAKTVKWLGKQSRHYQRKLIEAGKAHKQNRSWVAGIWRSVPGSGKTQAILELVSELGLKTIVICPNESIYKQWIKRARQDLGIEPGEIQGKKCVIGDLLTVAMQKTLWTRDISSFVNEFGAVIVDEAQKGAAHTYQEVIDKFPALFRLAVSGDEQRADGLEFLIYDQFGELDIEISRSEVKAEGGVVDVDVVLVPTNFRADWYMSLKSKYRFRKRAELLNLLTTDQERNNTIIEIANRSWNENREQVMIMTDRVEHCNYLLEKLQETQPTSLLSSNKKFEENTQLFAEGKNIFAVGTYKAVGVGFESHPELSVGIFTSPIGKDKKGRMQFSQFRFRYGRSAPWINKKRGIVYYMYDPWIYGKGPIKLIQKWLEEEESGTLYVLEDDKLVHAQQWMKKHDWSKYEKTEFD